MPRGGDGPGPAMTAEEIRRLRVALDMNQGQIGALLGVSGSTFCRWETARTNRKPSRWFVDVLSTIAEGIRHCPGAVDLAHGFLSQGLQALALGALLTPVVAAACTPEAPPVGPLARDEGSSST